MRTGDAGASIQAADHALDLAEHLGLDLVIAETFNNKGSSLTYLGRQREGLALLGASIALAQSSGYVNAEIRARSNVAGSSDDPRRALEIVERGLDLSRRVGNRSMANWATINRLYVTYLLAEGWDEALAEAESELAEMRAGSVASPLDEIRSLSIQGLIRVARGDPTDVTLAELEALVERTSDSFGVAAVHFLRGDRAFIAGDHAAAWGEMLEGSNEPNIGDLMITRALRAALWSGDARMAGEIADRLDAHPSSAASTRAARIAARAGIAALDGRREEAIARYQDALARYRAVNQDFDLACTGLDFVFLVGPQESLALTTADEARAILARVGARPYLDRLEAALSRPAAAAKPTQSDLVAERTGSRG